MQAADGKFYLTDAAVSEQLPRLIQTIPSPKAEPFKLWLARALMSGWRKSKIRTIHGADAISVWEKGLSEGVD